VLVGEVRCDGAVDELDSGRCQTHEAAAAIVRGIRPQHEPALAQPVDPFGQPARRHHRVIGQFAGRQLERRSRTPQRGQQVELGLTETELRIHVGDLGRESQSKTVDATDHPLRRRVEVGSLATPLLLNEVNVVEGEVDVIRHASTIPSVEGTLSSVEDKSRRWMLITAIAPIAWGSTYFVTRHLLPPDAALWGAVIRCLPAGLLVLLVTRRLPRSAWWWRSFVLGGLTVGGLNVLVYIAAQRLATSLAATIMSASAAALLLLSWVILHQRPALRAAAGAALGIVGVIVMLQPGGGDADGWGIAASVVAMLSSSLGFVLTRRWGSDVPPLTMTAWQLIAGSLLVAPIAVVVEGPPPALDGPALLGFAYLVLVATALAYTAWFTGLARLPGAVLGVLGLLNPVTGVLLGVIVAHEPFGPAQLIGLALVVIGVLAGTRPTRRAGSAASTPSTPETALVHRDSTR